MSSIVYHTVRLIGKKLVILVPRFIFANMWLLCHTFFITLLYKNVYISFLIVNKSKQPIYFKWCSIKNQLYVWKFLKGSQMYLRYVKLCIELLQSWYSHMLVWCKRDGERKLFPCLYIVLHVSKLTFTNESIITLDLLNPCINNEHLSSHSNFSDDI